MSDLDFLKGVTPVETSFQKANRGRQPGENVMEAHVVKSYTSPKALAIEVPAAKAHTVERAIRRAGTAHDWKVSVQVLKVHPDKAKSADVIALRELADLTADDGDVWISFKAMDKPADTKTSKTADATGDKATAAPSDPFQGTADADTGTGAKVAGKPAVRKATASA